MTLKEFYEQIDGSYEDTLHRLTSEALVHRFVLKYPADPSFAQLREAVAAADWESAFRAAHTMKGISRDLGFTPLFEASSALSDALRLDDAGVPADMSAVPELLRATEEAYQRTVAAVSAL